MHRKISCFSNCLCIRLYMSRNDRKRTSAHERQVKIQISLRIRAVWSESSPGAFRIVKSAKFLHADNEDSDRSARMGRLIWVFIGRICPQVRFLALRFRFCIPQCIPLCPSYVILSQLLSPDIRFSSWYTCLQNDKYFQFVINMSFWIVASISTDLNGKIYLPWFRSIYLVYNQCKWYSRKKSFIWGLYTQINISAHDSLICSSIHRNCQ